MHISVHTDLAFLDLRVYVSRNDPSYIIITDRASRHQALADFYWSAPDDQLLLLPDNVAEKVLRQVPELKAVAAAIREEGSFRYAA